MSIETAHRETHFEKYVVSKLKAHGWKEGHTKHYDIEHALYPEDLIAWLEATQPDKWVKIQKDNPENPVLALMDRLAKVLKDESTIHALRRGFSIAGCGHLDLSEAAPEDRRNEDVVKRYNANILRVVPQLKYHPAREFAVDLVFFINGIPVATVEIKTDFTQSIDAAVEQYKSDNRLPRDPKTKREEPLLTFKRGAVVHFAMSDSEMRMTTKLDGENTNFLHFNVGHNGHAGNPPMAPGGDYPVAYFWEKVCQRDTWLRIFHSFVYLEEKFEPDVHGVERKKERLIFPRYHQLDAVNAMLIDAKDNGSGMPYLCEHSPGSGKTSTIAWTAHGLIKLRTDDGKPVFDSVVVVTDRNVLDNQLQKAIRQLDKRAGVVAAIAREQGSGSKSKQLAESLLGGSPIIVVTIQTFPYAMEAILTDKKLKEKGFAVIVDEAHTSQTGTSSDKLKKALGLADQDWADSTTVEELLAMGQKSRTWPKNISRFAFTATPKHSTFMLFGRTQDGKKASKENLPQSFHKYPMRQAIEEGFILDVLTGYTPYKTAYNLASKVVDDKRISQKSAKRALAKWMTLHPTNVTQKVQFIVEHFAGTVAHLLDGKAKAMVVTSSRAAVVRYKRGFDAFIAEHLQYQHIKSLVAFSGKLKGREVSHPNDPELAGQAFAVDPEADFSEGNMNPGVPSSDLAASFERAEYRIMLVADKFQTGFDQPKLVAMYLDKKIGNDVEIVQTLSRLNRCHPGKEDVYIIDFVNDPDNVRRAFAKYDAGAVIQDVQDLNVVYDIQRLLDAQEIYKSADLEAFKQARFRSAADFAKPHRPKDADPQHKGLFAATDGPSRIWAEKVKGLRKSVSEWEAAFTKATAAGNDAGALSADIQRRTYDAQLKALLDFKGGLGRFCRTYAYIAQLVDLGDPELENFAAFAKLLQSRLKGIPPDEVDLKGLVLSGFDIKEREESKGEKEEDAPVVKPISSGGQVRDQDDRAYLREIIDQLNRIFGEATPLQAQVAYLNGIAAPILTNEMVMAQVQNATREQALKGNLPGAVQQSVWQSRDSHQKLSEQVMSDKQTMVALTNLIYELVRNNRIIDPRDLGV
jgi:type I restriction enzyme R subunit